jgi:multidrug efflux system membrane fusion protein
VRPNQLIVIASAVWLAGCSKETAKRETPPPVQPVAVRVAAVASESWSGIYEATGTVRARTVATLSSKVLGYVQQVNAREGEHVRTGELLIVIEARDLDAASRKAELGRSEVQTSIPEADYAMAGARANLELAQVTFKRVQDLASKKSLTTQEFDEASARVKAAQANYDMARSRRTQLDSRLAQAEQEIRTADIARDYTKIAAPFPGLVTVKSVEAGNLATPGAPLLTLEQDGAYRLEASVDESKVPAVRLGQVVEVALDAIARKVTARVSEIVPSVDAASRAYTVKLDLPAIPELRTGMFGRACFPQSARTLLTVASAAVVHRGQVQQVFVAENGAAHIRMVTLGQGERDSVEVLSGLSAGEKVVAPVPADLRDGSPLEIRQ